MDDPHRVGFAKRVADLLEDVLRARGLERAVPLEHGGEALALDEVHDHVEDAVVGLAEVVELDGVGVLQPGDGRALALEALRGCLGPWRGARGGS